MSDRAHPAMGTRGLVLLSAVVLAAAAPARGDNGPVLATLAPDDRNVTRF